MTEFSHEFIKNYTGVGAFGMDRDTDEETIMFYLQAFSDDSFMKFLLKKLSDEELEEIYAFIYKYLKKHMTEDEYHTHFLKEESHSH